MWLTFDKWAELDLRLTKIFKELKVFTKNLWTLAKILSLPLDCLRRHSLFCILEQTGFTLQSDLTSKWNYVVKLAELECQSSKYWVFIFNTEIYNLKACNCILKHVYIFCYFKVKLNCHRVSNFNNLFFFFFFFFFF